jgi:hypothetical protein
MQALDGRVGSRRTKRLVTRTRCGDSHKQNCATKLRLNLPMDDDGRSEKVIE